MRVKSRRRRRTKREIIQDDLLKIETQRTMAEFARKKTPPIKLIESKPKPVSEKPELKIVLRESKPKIVLTETKSKTTEKEKEPSES